MVKQRLTMNATIVGSILFREWLFHIFSVACRQSKALSDATQHAKSEKLGGKSRTNRLTIFSTVYRAPPI